MGLCRRNLEIDNRWMRMRSAHQMSSFLYIELVKGTNVGIFCEKRMGIVIVIIHVSLN